MNCYKTQSLISAYVDGELPGVEMLAIRQHLGDCTNCSMEFESILYVKRSMAALATKNPSADLASRICSQLDLPVGTKPHGIQYVLQRYMSGLSGGLRLASVAAGLFIAITFVVRGGSQPGMVYSPKSPTTFVQSIEGSDPMRVFSVSHGVPAASMRMSPSTIPASDDWGFGSVSARSVRVPANGHQWLTGY